MVRKSSRGSAYNRQVAECSLFAQIKSECEHVLAVKYRYEVDVELYSIKSLITCLGRLSL